MTVAEMQEKILAMGWQFQEHVFNDGGPDCYVRLSKSEWPLVFDCDENDEHSVKERASEIGWGRFDRQYAWSQALEAITKLERAGYDSLAETR